MLYLDGAHVEKQQAYMDREIMPALLYVRTRAGKAVHVQSRF